MPSDEHDEDQREELPAIVHTHFQAVCRAKQFHAGTTKMTVK
jgi:hypothetical protein